MGHNLRLDKLGFKDSVSQAFPVHYEFYSSLQLQAVHFVRALFYSRVPWCLMCKSIVRLQK